MSLITMGWGHLAVITMGLGISFRFSNPVRILQAGRVLFQDTTPSVGIEETIPIISIKAKEVVVTKENIQKEVKYE